MCKGLKLKVWPNIWGFSASLKTKSTYKQKNNKRNNKRRTCREERVVDVKHGANSSSFPCWGRYASRLHFNSSYPTTPSPPFGAISPTGIVPSHIPIPSTPPTPSPVMYVSTNDPVHPPPAVQPQEDKRRNREPIHLTPLMEQVAQRLMILNWCHYKNTLIWCFYQESWKTKKKRFVNSSHFFSLHFSSHNSALFTFQQDLQEFMKLDNEALVAAVRAWGKNNSNNNNTNNSQQYVYFTLFQ